MPITKSAFSPRAQPVESALLPQKVIAGLSALATYQAASKLEYSGSGAEVEVLLTAERHGDWSCRRPSWCGVLRGGVAGGGRDAVARFPEV